MEKIFIPQEAIWSKSELLSYLSEELIEITARYVQSAQESDWLESQTNSSRIAEMIRESLSKNDALLQEFVDEYYGLIQEWDEDERRDYRDELIEKLFKKEIQNIKTLTKKLWKLSKR